MSWPLVKLAGTSAQRGSSLICDMVAARRTAVTRRLPPMGAEATPTSPRCSVQGLVQAGSLRRRGGGAHAAHKMLMTPLVSLPAMISVSGRKPRPGPVALRRRPGTESTVLGAPALTSELSPPPPMLAPESWLAVCARAPPDLLFAAESGLARCILSASPDSMPAMGGAATGICTGSLEAWRARSAPAASARRAARAHRVARRHREGRCGHRRGAQVVLQPARPRLSRAPQASLRHAVTLWLGSLHGACRRARAQQAGQAGWRAQRSCMHLKLVENQDKRTVHSAKK